MALAVQDDTISKHLPHCESLIETDSLTYRFLFSFESRQREVIVSLCKPGDSGNACAALIFAISKALNRRRGGFAEHCAYV